MSCLTIYDCKDYSTPGFPDLHHLLEFEYKIFIFLINFYQSSVALQCCFSFSCTTKVKQLYVYIYHLIFRCPSSDLHWALLLIDNRSTFSFPNTISSVPHHMLRKWTIISGQWEKQGQSNQKKSNLLSTVRNEE